ncbi:MAG TPA: glycosyl hydrolase [Opitutales bacterium]|nr:glycosyl hydrolase [Opitutales bacterium]
MKSPLRLITALSLTILAFAGAPSLHAANNAAADALQTSFNAPPNEARPMVRWWWFGPAVVKPELEKELGLMKAGGFGGFEVQPTYPLALDGQYPGLLNLKFLSPEFFDMIGFTAAKAKELGLRFDLTLGSGWPYGGPMFSREEAVQSLGQSTVAIQPGQTAVTAPAGGGRRGGAASGPPTIHAAVLGPVTDAVPGKSPYLPLKVENGAALLPADLHGATQVTFFTYAQAGLMQVKRPAYGAEGFIVDHYAPGPIKKFIDDIALPEINACGPNLPFSIFCDSLEVSGEGWTPNFLAEFEQRRGYDLTPLLPALFGNGGGIADYEDVRADYGKTVIEVFNDNFVKTFTKLAHDHNTRFRIQAYGTPPTTLMTYADADLDEGENYNWRQFSATRWASSASHLLGRPMASAEAFTWIHSPVFMAAPIDIKAESNLDFLNGINQFLCHGWPYTAPGVEYPGWRFYAAGVFDEKNPWWIAMPDVNNYLARSSYLLRQGVAANDVALYLPEEDTYAEMTPGNLQFAAAGGGLLGRSVNGLIPTILDAGYNFDFLDDGVLALRGKVEGNTLTFGDTKYKVIILPATTRIPLATLQKFAEFANNGGILLCVGDTPSRAPGFHATEADNQAVKDLSAKIFSGAGAKGQQVSAAQLGATLQAKLRPDVAYTQVHSELGFVHRHTDAGEIYFLVNTSNQPVSDTATIRVDGLKPEWWDPVTGKVSPVAGAKIYSGATGIPVSLPAYGAQFLVFTSRALPATNKAAASAPAQLDLSKDWAVTFKNSAPEPDPAPAHLDAGASWTDSPALQFFSGVATYEKQVNVPAALVAGSATGQRQYLDFGDGTPANQGGGQGFRAALQTPIADAAVVWVNGQRAGALWCPPYRVDVTGLLKAGANTIRIQVANRATNYMADQQNHPLPDYSALNADPRLGGNRFGAQDLNQIHVLPSGLLGTVKLVAE